MGNQARVEQVTMRIPPVNQTETRRQLEKFIEDAIMWRDTAAVRRETAMTPNYSIRDYSSNSGISKPVEDVALHNAEVDLMMEADWKAIQLALGKLKHLERKLVELRYMQQEPPFDYEVYNQMGISDSTYKRIKHRAIKKMAFSLGIAVFHKM